MVPGDLVVIAETIRPFACYTNGDSGFVLRKPLANHLRDFLFIEPSILIDCAHPALIIQHLKALFNGFAALFEVTHQKLLISVFLRPK